MVRPQMPVYTSPRPSGGLPSSKGNLDFLIPGILVAFTSGLPLCITMRLCAGNSSQESSTNLAGSLTFEGLCASTVEEILFRGLLVTFLVQRMSGRLRLGRFDLHVAGVIVAVLFCLAHLGSFWTQSFRVAASQQAYAFVWGVIYAYWYEKSGSLLPSFIGHNA